MLLSEMSFELVFNRLDTQIEATTPRQPLVTSLFCGQRPQFNQSGDCLVTIQSEKMEQSVRHHAGSMQAGRSMDHDTATGTQCNLQFF